MDDRTLERLVAIAERIYSSPGRPVRGRGRPGDGGRAGLASLLVPRRGRPKRTRAVRVPAQPLLDEYSLASRLSYFLWSTMPDDELFAVGRAAELRENLASRSSECGGRAPER